MADISDSVGTGGINAIHDVALVQLILKTLKNSHQASYFGSPYTNGYSGETARAIAAFQADQNLIGGTNREIQGPAKAGSATWLALRAAFTEAAPPYVEYALSQVDLRAKLAATLARIVSTQVDERNRLAC